jgi:hypothetical protein
MAVRYDWDDSAQRYGEIHRELESARPGATQARS